MKMNAMKKALASLLAVATVLCSMSVTAASAIEVAPAGNTGITAGASASVEITASEGYEEAGYVQWGAVTGATGYNVYADGTQIDSMLIRQYSGYFRADALGLKAGSHTLKVVPVISGKEDTSKAAEAKITAIANDRSGFGWVGGTSSGAYNEDGTLKSNATVVYVTNATKDTVSVTLPDKKGADTVLTGAQNIITGLKSNEKCGPVCIRFIGNITDPDVLTKGDMYVDTATCGLTIEGVGTDTTFNGFGLVLKNCSNVEVRNIGFMNCNSSEGDNVGLQQGNDHCWVHHCDMFYGDAGSDADQVKGDGALDTKKSTYITHSYNHFWDNGKCNLQGMKSETTENYITYHHNWYDHSDSRHPRIRTCSVHIYNNYFDGNAKYGVGVTMKASAFVENNYFRNCKYPMLSSMQGSDIANGTANATFSGEDGGIIKSYGNYMTGDLQKGYVTYQENSTDFDAYEAKSRDEQVPSSVVTKQGGTTYNNFDTNSGLMYTYTPDKAEDVPAIVTAHAGRAQGGDFQWKFDNSTADASYTVDQALKDALVAYDDSIIAIGSGFKEDNAVKETTAPVQTTAPAQTTKTTQTQATLPPADYSDVIYVSPNGTGSGKTESDPTDVLTAIKNVPAGGMIYLLGGTYKYTDTILIDQNNSGSAGKYKTISAYNGANVVFDFTGQEVSGSARGFVLDGSYWHFYGFEVTQAGDNGMLLSGNNNIVENMVFNDNEDTGLQISRYRTDAATIADWPTNNLVKNCTSKNNCDEATMENADGFAAKLTCGEGNVFDGCISYNNSDDGWDLYAKEATGPIGVVTLKNCIAFRNGFTEDGRGYGDCDGNGFKLGGGGIGTRHVVENCLAFENLNCGFTDNNNPEFGDMKNCTAYNNNLKGQKANYMVYRCNTTATFENMMSYYNVANVSKTNAAGIKAGNDKFVGSMKNGIYYNSKYYFAKSETMTNGAKLGDIITPTDSDFITLSVPAMGTDFHTVWRNADGTPNPQGFAETPSDGTYASLGYHMYNGVKQETPVPVETTKPATTTAPASSGDTPVTPVVTGDYDQNFTADGKESSFYNITGNLSDSKGTVTYNGQELTQCLKIEGTTEITFNAPSAGTITLVFGDNASTIKVNGTKYQASADSNILTIDVNAGTNTITKANAANLYYMAYNASGSSDTPVETKPATTTAVPAETTAVPDETTPSQPSGGATKYGDIDNDGDVDIVDVLSLNQYLLGIAQLSPEGSANADVNQDGSIGDADAMTILKSLVKLATLPEF